MADNIDKSQEDAIVEDNLVSGEPLESWPGEKKKRKKNSKRKKSAKEDEADEEEIEKEEDAQEENKENEERQKEEQEEAEEPDAEEIKEEKKRSSRKVARRERKEKEEDTEDTEKSEEPVEDDEEKEKEQEQKKSKAIRKAWKKELKENSSDKEIIEYKRKTKKENKHNSNVQYFWYAIILLIIAGLLLFQFREPAGTNNSSIQKEEQVLAKVNGEPITQNQVDAVYNSLSTETKGAVTKDNILNSLIRDKVLVQEAEKEGIKGNNNNEKIEKLLQAQLSQIEVSEAEIEAYYEASKERFNLSESVRVQFILLCYNESIGCESNVPEDFVKINVGRLIRMIDSDVSFSELALNHSKDSTVGINKGDVGYITKGQTHEEFERLAFSLEKGEVSFTKTEYGYYIIKVLDHREPGILPLDIVREQINRELRQQKVQQFIETYILVLMKKANIEYTNEVSNA